jgi:hypothetical protein
VYSPVQQLVGRIRWENWRTSVTILTFFLALFLLFLPSLHFWWLLLVSKRYSCPPFLLFAFLRHVQTLPSAILQQKRQKDRISGSGSTSSTSLLEDRDTLHYRSIEDNMQHCGGSLTKSEISQPPSLLALMTPQVLTALIVHGILCFCDISMQVLIPLMWSTSLEHGGLGFTPYTIGLTLGIYGVVNVSLQVMLLGKLIRRFGPRKVVIVSFPAFILSLSCFPLAGCFARRAGGADWRVWTVIMVQLAMDSLKFYASCKLLNSL